MDVGLMWVITRFLLLHVLLDAVAFPKRAERGRVSLQRCAWAVCVGGERRRPRVRGWYSALCGLVGEFVAGRWEH